MKYIFILLAVAFWSCGHSGHDQNHNHKHDHDHDHESHDHNHETQATAGGDHRGEIVFTREQAEAIDLTVETVEPGEFRQIIEVAGRIQSAPGDETVIVATSNGIVSFTGTSLSEGTAVTKGQIIATVSAQNLVDGDPAAKALIEYESAEREYRRAEELVADQIVSRKDFDEARRRYEIARAALPSGTSRAGVKVMAPIGGYVKNILVGEGEYVSAGQPVAVVSRNGKLRLRAEVPERHSAALPSIAGANFRLPYAEKVYRTSRLVSYGRAVEGFYVPVIFEFANVGGVMPGAFVEVWLLGEPARDVLSVPVNALSEEQGLYFVYLQHGAEDYAKQQVAVGPDNGERVRILSGLKPGDRVVTNGVTQVRLAAMSGIIPEGHTH